MKKKKDNKDQECTFLEIPVAVMLIILTLLVLVPGNTGWYSVHLNLKKKINFVAAYIYTEFIYFGKLYRCTGPY